MAKTINPLDTSQMIDLSALMLLTVQALQQLGNSGHIKEIDDVISDIEELTEEEQAILMPNGKHPRFNYYSAWARTYLKKAGVSEGIPWIPSCADLPVAKATSKSCKACCASSASCTFGSGFGAARSL